MHDKYFPTPHRAMDAVIKIEHVLQHLASPFIEKMTNDEGQHRVLSNSSMRDIEAKKNDKNSNSNSNGSSNGTTNKKGFVGLMRPCKANQAPEWHGSKSVTTKTS